MRGVVHPDAQHHPGPRDRRADAQAGDVELRQDARGEGGPDPGDALVGEEPPVDVRRDRAQVQVAAVGGEQYGDLVAGGADTHESHLSSYVDGGRRVMVSRPGVRRR
jgi:hypothetical protein